MRSPLRAVLALLALFVLALAPGVSAAQLLTLGVSNSPSGGGGGGGGALTITRGTVNDLTAQTTYSLPASFGAESPTRRIVAAIGATSSSPSANITSVTLGGVAAVRQQAEAGNASRILEFWAADVPTNATPTITVDIPIGAARVSVQYWAILGSSQSAYASRSAPNIELNSSANLLTSGAVTVPSGGILLAVVRIGNAAGGPVTWSQSAGTGAEWHDATVGTNHWQSAYDSTEAGTYTVTADGGDALYYKLGAIAWGP